MIRFSSRRFIARNDHTFPEHSARIPRVTRRISLVFRQSGPRPGDLRARTGGVRK
jgi:hypothetical protein